MYEFFDLTEHSEVQIPMYGTVHLLTVIGMLLLVAVLFWKRSAVKKLANNQRFIKRFIWVYIGIEVFFWALQWIYRIEPLYERFPLHLCGSLSVLMPILILLNRDDLLRFFSYWSICAGFISFANPGFVFEDIWSFGFIHYLLRHYFLFVVPIFLQIGREYTHSYRNFLVSAGTLIGYAGLIFLLDWATGANYMHLGQHNPLEIPFLPASFTVWPWSYPSFVAVGFILFNLSFLLFSKIGRGKQNA